MDIHDEINYLKDRQKEVIASIKDEDSFESVAVKLDKLYFYNSHIKDLEYQLNNLNDILDNPFKYGIFN